MCKTKVLTVLFVMLLVPVMMFAGFKDHIDRIEFGPAVGVGFYVGQPNPFVSDNSLVRIQTYDVLDFKSNSLSSYRWPGIETFGFQAGYRFDMRWHLQLKTVRQRVNFVEQYEGVRALYYNAMWHVDAMAEFNILRYGNKMTPEQGVYNVVPYVGLGLGVTMYNQNATLRAVNVNSGTSYKDINTWQPMVGKLYQGKDPDGKAIKTKNEIGVGMYIPVAFGVKWRLNDNVQLIGAFQYQMYLSGTKPGSGLNSNLGGATGGADAFGYYQGVAADNIKSRPTFDELNKKALGAHNCLFSITAVFNLQKWYEERLVY